MKSLSFFFKRFFILILIVFIVSLITITIKISIQYKTPKKPFSFARFHKTSEVIKKNVFEDGEIIKFGIYSYGLRVGSGELNYLGLKEENGKKYQHIVFKASTLSVQDEDSVEGDLSFSHPLKVDRNVSLFGKKELISELYSEDRKTVNISKTVNAVLQSPERITSQEKLTNVFLLIYSLRNDKEIKVGRVYPINLPTQKFELIVDSRKKIKVPLGEFDVFYLESRPPKYKIWLQAQNSRLPVRIQGLVAGGMVYLAATEVLFQKNRD